MGSVGIFSAFLGRMIWKCSAQILPKIDLFLGNISSNRRQADLTITGGNPWVFKTSCMPCNLSLEVSFSLRHHLSKMLFNIAFSAIVGSSLVLATPFSETTLATRNGETTTAFFTNSRWSYFNVG